MKSFLRSFIGIFAITASALAADDGSPLPFPVKVGGQAATYQKGEPFAKVAKPVAANADLAVETKADLIIVNIAKLNERNETNSHEQPVVILLSGTTKATLDKTMDGRKLAPGTYLLSVSGAERTATIRFSVQ